MVTSGSIAPVRILDLDKPESLSFTVPLSFRFYRHSKTEVVTWRELYDGVVKHLCQKYPAILLPENTTTSPLTGDIGDLKASKAMKAPCLVKRGIYLETGISADSMIRKIRNIMQSCEMDLAHLQIEYYLDTKRKDAFTAQREKAAAEPKYLKLQWNYNVSYTGATPVSFRYKKKRTQVVQTWAGLYARVITLLAQDYPRIIKDGVSFGGGKRIDVSRANRRNISMMHPVDIGNNLVLETFGSSTQLIDRMYSALTLCRVNPEELLIYFTFGNVEQDMEYAGKKPSSDTPSTGKVNIEKALANRLRFVLGKYFDNGYRIESSIERSRLYAFYQRQYREELVISEDEIDTVLLTLAKPIDGKILIKNQAAIETLMKDVVATVDEAFKDGATCIYTSELRQLYLDELSRNGIHDLAPFEELVMDSLGNEFRAQYNRICFGRRKADVGSDIRNYMKGHPEVLSLEDFRSRFWYYPEAIIEKTLKGSEDIVLVSPDCYFYAPNLPLRNSDRTLIESSLRTILMVRHEVTELEMLEAVLQTCPQLLSEVAELSWNGLKGSLAYLFRDALEFQDYRIIAKQR